MPAAGLHGVGHTTPRISAGVNGEQLSARVDRILNRWPAVGLAVGVVGGGGLEFFHGHGLADIASNTPVTEDTVFRIASVTKTFTAIAVMQLCEQGLIDLDTPANHYLRAFRLIPAEASWRPATVRHLLTHTAGIPDVVRISDLLHPGWGSFGARPASGSVSLGEQLPPLGEYYGGALRVLAEPGTAFSYTNHGFATLGQIVEDVSKEPLDRYFRERIFEPLGMADTDLLRSKRLEARLATGYEIGRGGPRAVTDRTWVTAAASSIYSTPRDMGRFAGALLQTGAGSILRPETLATLFQPHYRPHPCLPGVGLGLFREAAGGHLVVGHDGRLPGFNAQLLVAPDDGMGVIGFTNGSKGAFAWLSIELGRLLHDTLDVPAATVRHDLPHRPEIWAGLCGRYRLPPRVSDLRGRAALSTGVDVVVRGGRPVVRLPVPVPSLYRGLPLHPDDEHDPYIFRVDLSPLQMPTVRVVFDLSNRGRRAIHTDLASLSLFERPSSRASVPIRRASRVTEMATGRGSRRNPEARA